MTGPITRPTLPDRIGLPLFAIPIFAQPDYEIPFVVDTFGFPPFVGLMNCCGPANALFDYLIVWG
jgi:hypothetical protein